MIKINGWTYDPGRGIWFANASDGVRWIAFAGGRDDVPGYRPDAFLPG